MRAVEAAAGLVAAAPRLVELLLARRLVDEVRRAGGRSEREEALVQHASALEQARVCAGVVPHAPRHHLVRVRARARVRVRVRVRVS